MRALLLIALGGGIGSALRFALYDSIRVHSSNDFPWGTLAVNVTGCLAIGLLFGLWFEQLRESWRAFLLFGVLGGYTTFSSFGKEAITLLLNHRYIAAAGYVFATNILCLAAVWLGVVIMRR